MIEYWSWILTAMGVFGLYLAGSGKRQGWLVGLTTQIVWLIFGLTTQQYGFVVSAFVYAAVYLRNFTRQRADSDKKGVTDA